MKRKHSKASQNHPDPSYEGALFRLNIQTQTMTIRTPWQKSSTHVTPQSNRTNLILSAIHLPFAGLILLQQIL